MALTEAPATPVRRRPAAKAAAPYAIAVAGLIGALILGFVVHAPTIWGLLPIIMYAVLSLCGMNLLLATVVSLLAAILLVHRPPTDVGTLLGTSLGDTVTLIGLICLLGAGLGEVLRQTGAAGILVRGILRMARRESQLAICLSVMMSCLVLTFALGTLAGALAIVAPIVIPVTARAGLTRSTTATVMFLGGCAGLALAPFAGSNIAILDASGLDYGTYVLVGAGPLTVLSLALALLVVPRVQRRSAASGDDFYTDIDTGAGDQPSEARGVRATWAFSVVLVFSVGYATASTSGTAFPLLALPAMAALTAAAGGLSVKDTIDAFCRGAARMVETFLLFWMLAAFFLTVNELKPYDVLLHRFGPQLHGLAPLPFAIAVALLGWLGVPGATAAHVVLLNKVFGPLGTSIGLTPTAWAVTYLWGSKADTYGPYPNPNMMAALGFAEGTRLRTLLSVGWTLLVPAAVMYALILAVLL
ncbi:Na+/H+ antiporter NhaC family protein [Streptomyces violaceusniger]|uniref:Permease n=1 Tax=Streptomyces violaceusniger TaxID=68280 RepID=A0A4D4KS85_STRVO|nr:permease [Streptomyces violaceusniger]